jgi:DnaJ family protein C protein 19
MGIFYLIIGCLIVLGLHMGLARLQNASRAIRRGALIALVIVIALVLLRVGAPYLAAGFSGLMALVAVVSRLAIFAPFLGLFRHRNNPSAPATRTAMSSKEAREILGVAPTASPADIKAAYQKLMQKLHPDVGGNDYLASQLNQAKEVLLKK